MVWPLVQRKEPAVPQHSGELVVTEDIARDPNWERFRDLALGHNLRSCWSVPLLSHQGNVLGTFALYHNRVHAPDEAQIQRLVCAAHLAVIAIRHERDGQRLEESEQRFGRCSPTTPTRCSPLIWLATSRV